MDEEHTELSTLIKVTLKKERISLLEISTGNQYRGQNKGYASNGTFQAVFYIFNLY